LGESLVQAAVERRWLAPYACCQVALVIAACSKLSAVLRQVIKIKILHREDRDNDLIRGSPCLTPLLHLNIFPSVPLSRIEDLPEVRIFSIQFIHFAGKPLCFMTWRLTWCSTLSKAFSKSSFRITISFLECWQR